MNVAHLTIADIADGLKEKTFSSVELTKAYLSRIKMHDKNINAFLHIDEEISLRQAQLADKALSKGNAHPLCGVPCAIKDNFCSKDMPATAGSKILQDYVPTYNATCVQKLYDVHMVNIGKVNTDEFTMGTTTEFSAFKTTKNPFHTDYVAGGSSGGSAAAVASGFAPYSLGTDTGGSIRLPASFCSTVGMKNTYGRVSRYGVMSMASSLDTIGTLTKTVQDAALVLSVIAGKDVYDATTSNQIIPAYQELLETSVKGKVIGVPKEYFIEGIDAQVRNAVEDALEIYKEMGAQVKEISLAHTHAAIAVYYIICSAEVSSNLSRYDGLRFGVSQAEMKQLVDRYLDNRTSGFGSEVKRRIMMGTYVLSSGYYDAYYKKAQQVRALIKRDFDEAFKEVDVIVTPSAATPPFKIGEKVDNPLQMYLTDIFTVSANLAGICALSIPCGFTEKQLPIGMQIMGNQWKEELILSFGHQFQKQTHFHTILPSF